MKKIKLMLALCALITFTLKSQPYGTQTYFGTAFFMSSGTVCTATPGLVMAAYIPALGGAGANFLVNRP